MKIAVIGLGSSGSMALWRLSSLPGIEAIGFEQFGIGHGYGSYSGESRLFRAAYHEGEKYVPLLRRAKALWRELETVSGRTLFHHFGVISIGHEGDPSFERLLESIELHGLPHKRFNAAQLRAEYPQLDIADDEVGVLDLEGGALRPELAVASAIERARVNGAEVRDHCRITAIVERSEAEGGGLVITSEAGDTVVDRVIVTAGSWSKFLIPELAELVQVRKIVLTWFVPDDASQYQPETLPCFIRDRDGFHVFGAPIVDGYSVKIAGVDVWGVPDTARPEKMNLRLDPAAVSEFGRQAKELFPGIFAEPNRYSVHHDGFTANKTPIIDRCGDVVVIAGLSGHGFKLSPALGDLAAELATVGKSELHHPDFEIAAHEPVI